MQSGSQVVGMDPLAGRDALGGGADWKTVFYHRLAARNRVERHFMTLRDRFLQRQLTGGGWKRRARRQRGQCHRYIVVWSNLQ